MVEGDESRALLCLRVSFVITATKMTTEMAKIGLKLTSFEITCSKADMSILAEFLSADKHDRSSTLLRAPEIRPS